MREETIRIIGTLFVIITIVTTILLVVMSICRVSDNIILLFILVFTISVVGMLISICKLA